MAFESNLRKKLAIIEHALIVKVYFERRKMRKFSLHTCKISFESHFRKRLSKENFMACHYLYPIFQNLINSSGLEAVGIISASLFNLPFTLDAEVKHGERQ